MITKQAAMEFCHKKAYNTIDGRSNETSLEWTRLEADIRDNGLEAVVGQSQSFLERARSDRSGQRTYNTAVTEEFLRFVE